MQNICNLIVPNSVHISDIFNCYSVNINGALNSRKLGGKSKIFAFTLTQNMYVKLKGRSTLVLNLCSILIYKILASEFMTAKVSQNPNTKNVIKMKSTI